MTRPAPSCFTEDNTRAEGFSGAQIYSQMHGGPGTASADVAATAAAGLGRDYAGIEARLKRVSETLGEAWSGASASAAQAAGNPINQAMIQMQDALKQADHSISNQIHQFTLNKGQLKNMPASKPDTNLWDDATPWDTDTEDKVNSYNSEEAHNRGVYKEFQSASNTNRGELPKEFPGVLTDSLVVEIAQTGGNNGEEKTTTTSTTTTRSSTTGLPPSTSTPQSTTGTGWTVPTTNGDQTTTSSSNTTDTTTTSNTNNTGRPDHLTTKPPVGSVIDRPNNTGLPPIGVPVRPNTGGPNGPGSRGGPGGPGASGGAGKFGGGGGGAGGAGKFGGGGLGGGAGKFSGGGLGGVGSGTAGGTAAQQPGGKAGVFGGLGETAAGARGGAAGTAGRAGAAGMGGMGGQGQKGQGEDDLEHKSADYLISEENTNEIIGDMPMVAPPTIGG
ncbi:hypothetical protein PV646_37280 [Streptomyces sp. ID05-26A]|nr:hypothetical protein [Streptomyces sp. ID05-26A]